VDRPEVLRGILAGVASAAKGLPVILPMHPRTLARLREHGITLPEGVRACAPQGYLAFVDLLRHARAVLTDSGGVQQEAAVLGIPCVTLRDRGPGEFAIGANWLPARGGKTKRAGELAALRGGLPPLWDGRARTGSLIG
jgi:UDP-N-acetylglucosamine 2-epimerase